MKKCEREINEKTLEILLLFRSFIVSIIMAMLRYKQKEIDSIFKLFEEDSKQSSFVFFTLNRIILFIPKFRIIQDQ